MIGIRDAAGVCKSVRLVSDVEVRQPVMGHSHHILRRCWADQRHLWRREGHETVRLSVALVVGESVSEEQLAHCCGELGAAVVRMDLAYGLGETRSIHCVVGYGGKSHQANGNNHPPHVAGHSRGRFFRKQAHCNTAVEVGVEGGAAARNEYVVQELAELVDL